MRVLFIFLDGVGLGIDDPDINPFAHLEMLHCNPCWGRADCWHLQRLITGSALPLLAIDAVLRRTGLPQSATGQAVFTHWT